MITQQQALEALEALRHAGPDGWGPIEHFTTLRQYIEQGAQPGADGRALLAEQARPTQVMQEARETLLIAAANFGGVAPSARDRCIRAANALHEVYTAQPLKAEQAKDAAEDAEILAAVHRELDDGDRTGNAPGHAHKLPGIWDDDNGAKSGKPCAWCLTWVKFTALIDRAARAAERKA